MTRTSVVVPTRDRGRHLLAALRPLLADPATDELVVVDDGSTDATAALLADLASDDGRVVVVRTEGVGASLARQVGVERATGDVVLFVDDDVVAGPALVAGHAAHHEREHGLVVVGHMPTTVPDDGRPDTVPVRIYAGDYRHQVDDYERHPDRVLLNLWGGNVSLRRADALAVGLAGPSGLVRHEDRDFGLRCRAAGLVGRFDRALAAEHRPTRDVATFRAVSHQQGVDVVRLHRAHAAAIGPDPAPVGAELPAVVRWLGAEPVAARGRPVVALLVAALPLLRSRRLRRVQTAVGVLIRVVEHQRGRMEHRASTPPR